MNRRIAILDAPSNLGLRPPTATSVPGCAKAPGALRDHGLVERLDARDTGCLTPPRYDPADWRPGDGVCHAPAIARYSMALAERIGAIIDAGEFPVILGGDCSILLGSALAMHRLGEAVGGRIGLVFVDGHSDFRHPGNASYVGAAAGEDLALVTGRGQADLAAIEGRRPYFRDIDVVVLGIRTQDEYRLDLQAAGIVTRTVPMLRTEGAARTAQWAHDQLADCAGYWVHVDVDVLDPAVMPAVDAPDPGGIAFTELELLIAGLVDTPHCLGIEITVFDPDYDPDGSYAAEIVATLVAGLSPVHRPEPAPEPAGPIWIGAPTRAPGRDPVEDPTGVRGGAPAADDRAVRPSFATPQGAGPVAPEGTPEGSTALGPENSGPPAANSTRAASGDPVVDVSVVGDPAVGAAVVGDPVAGAPAVGDPAAVAPAADPAAVAASARPAPVADAPVMAASGGVASGDDVSPVTVPPSGAPAAAIRPPDGPGPAVGPRQRVDSVIGLAEQVAAAGAAARDTVWRTPAQNAVHPLDQVTVSTPYQVDRRAVDAPEQDASGRPTLAPESGEPVVGAADQGVSVASSAPEQVAPEQVTPGQVTPEQVGPEQVTPERVVPERVPPEDREPVGPPASAGPGRLRRVSAVDVVIGRPGVAPGQRQPAADESADAADLT